MGKVLKLRIVLPILLVLMLAFAAGCGGGGAKQEQKPAEKKDQPQDAKSAWVKELNFLAANPGGEWYPLAVAVADIWTKNLTEIKVSIKPGGGVSNVVGVAQSKGHFGLTQPAMAAAGVNGIYPFTEKLPDDIRALAVLYPTTEQVVVLADAGINSIKDLKGKSINVYTKGYTSEAVAAAILEAYGLSYKDVSKVNYLNDSDCISSMKDGHVHATFSMGSVPDAGFIELGTTRKFKLISLEDDKIAAINKKNPGLVKRVIPKGSYPGQDSDVSAIGTNLMIAVNKSLPEDQVYQLTKHLAENLPKLYNVTESLKQVKPENLAAPPGVPFHPGAEKYYKEKGYLK